MINPFLYIKDINEKGRGVFTRQDIPENTLIEVAPVIVLSIADTKRIDATHLHDYYFSWDDNQKRSAIALGYVSMYNHQIDPNCIYECDFAKSTISIITRNRILANTELTINYNLDPMSTKKLWFEVK